MGFWAGIEDAPQLHDTFRGEYIAPLLIIRNQDPVDIQKNYIQLHV